MSLDQNARILRTQAYTHNIASHDVPDDTAKGSRASSESAAEMSCIMMPQHANAMGNVYGGQLLFMADQLAGAVAIRHARTACVTASVDRVDFREPVHVGDFVTLRASINFTGRTSMEIGVRIDAEDMCNGTMRHTNTCYFTFVALDGEGRPAPIPRVVPESADDIRRHDAAKERRRRRLEERNAEAQQTSATPRI